MCFSSQSKRALCELCACLFFQFATCSSFYHDESYNDGSQYDDPEDYGGGGVKITAGALIGIVIGSIALLIAILILFCFCCGCCCFKGKKQGVKPSATLGKEDASDKDVAIGIESSDENNPRLNTATSQQFISAASPPGHVNLGVDGHEPGLPLYPLVDNLRRLYPNLSYEPPPPYALLSAGR